eukprot:COSAG02_NODE_7681_length_2896_cov_2.780479_5_plen_23_part_01
MMMWHPMTGLLLLRQDGEDGQPR